jgi:hypothetical protein
MDLNDALVETGSLETIHETGPDKPFIISMPMAMQPPSLYLRK